VSIGTYLPSAMLVAVNFTFTSIALWVRSGMPGGEVVPGMEGQKADKARLAVERDLFLPLGVVTVCQALGVVPLWLFNHTPEQVSIPFSLAPFVSIMTNWCVCRSWPPYSPSSWSSTSSYPTAYLPSSGLTTRQPSNTSSFSHSPSCCWACSSPPSQPSTFPYPS
jgi:hypothetical protein